MRAADHAAASVGPKTPFNWGEGVLAYGLMEAWRVTKEPRYLEAVKRWADHHGTRGIGPTLSQRGYCGHWGPGTPLLLLYEATKDERYLRSATEVRAFIRDKATRTSDGALGHWRGNVQIWVDTLAMACPTLARYSIATKDASALDDAVRQLERAAKHQQDPKTGLFWHMWDERTGEHSEGVWGRGNGWVILSLVDTLEFLPEEHPARERLVGILRKQIACLVKLQCASGMWRTVLDRPEAYEETSATAMILYGIAKAQQLKLIADDHTPRLKRAWTALEKQVDARGIVRGTSAGTGPRGIDHYLKRPRGEYSWGTGAFLLAGARLREMGICAR
ncbi:glycoside hydrolase family 88 protein [bacterium]|nr:glycoside hydrolase family 88 protein [bacterium]